MKIGFHYYLGILLIIGMGCNSPEETKPTQRSIVHKVDKVDDYRRITKDFKDYWFTGTAEITSYKLMQERYGELREGTAVNIFVTEDFLPEQQVKANTDSTSNVPVLKLNQMKRFNTGIYPYSIMSSTFNPISDSGHALKVSTSVQEWCGQVYMQLNTQNEFIVESHSYFEGEADQVLKLKKTWLENELWNIIRLNPEELPLGDILIIPSFEYLRLRHKETKAYKAYATIKQGDSTTTYSINYPDLQRKITLNFKSGFPYEIEKWEEVNVAQQNDTLRLRTTAVKIKRIKTDYWNQNKNKFGYLRDSLGLH